MFYFRRTVVELQDKEIPDLRNKIQNANRDLTGLKGEIEEQELLLQTALSEEEGAKACLQDITLMERYQVCFGNFFLIHKMIFLCI